MHDVGLFNSQVACARHMPKGSEGKKTRLLGVDGPLLMEVNVQAVPPAPDEELMPPISSLTFRVLFYYSPYRSNAEFWKSEGKHWSKLEDKFVGPGPGVSAAVQQLGSASDSPEPRLRKMYAAIMPRQQ